MEKQPASKRIQKLLPGHRPVTDEARQRDYFEKIRDTHPPIDVSTVDYTVGDPRAVNQALGPEIRFSATVEADVARNVEEIETLFGDNLPQLDKDFVHMWGPQEIAHGEALDPLLPLINMKPPDVQLNTTSTIKLLGIVGRELPWFADIIRLQYYLTGASTEKSAIELYSSIGKKLKTLGETAINQTLFGQIKRQEPPHFAFYRSRAEQLVDELSPTQLFLARKAREVAYKPVGVINKKRQRQMGGILVRNIGETDQEVSNYAAKIGMLDGELLFASEQGLRVPPYIFRALRNARETYSESLAA